jgi:predicted aspartyl protease
MRNRAGGGSMRAITVLVVLLSFLAGLAQAQDKQEASFQLIRDYVIVVKGGIAGESNLHFIVDTGAVPSVLDKRLIQHLKAGGQERMLVFSKSMDLVAAEATDVSVGPWHQPSLSVLVSDLSFASEALGIRIDGMLGLDFFGSSFMIDYRRKKMQKIADSYERQADDLIIAHAPEESFATVEMSFAGRTLKLLADSGTSDLVFFEPRVQEYLTEMKASGGTNWSNAGGELMMKRVRLQAASIAGRSWQNRDALIMAASKGPEGLDGMLGLSAVGARRVVFLPPSANSATPVGESISQR